MEVFVLVLIEKPEIPWIDGTIAGPLGGTLAGLIETTSMDVYIHCLFDRGLRIVIEPRNAYR